MKKTFIEQVREALELGVAQAGSAYALSKKTGISKANMSRWLSATPPNTEAISPVMDYLGVSLTLPDQKLADFDLVPKVSAKAGAGASLETSDDVENFFAFRADFMGGQNISKNSVLMDVTGDSMDPTLRDGDTVLVDKSDTQIMDGQIYVVTLGEELRVKRVQRGLNGIILKSDNPNYSDIHVEPPDIETLIVHGRVRWFGRII